MQELDGVTWYLIYRLIILVNGLEHQALNGTDFGRELNLQEILIQDQVHDNVAGYPLRLIEVCQIQQHELNENNSQLQQITKILPEAKKFAYGVLILLALIAFALL